MLLGAEDLPCFTIEASLLFFSEFFSITYIRAKLLLKHRGAPLGTVLLTLILYFATQVSYAGFGRQTEICPGCRCHQHSFGRAVLWGQSKSLL